MSFCSSISWLQRVISRLIAVLVHFWTPCLCYRRSPWYRYPGMTCRLCSKSTPFLLYLMQHFHVCTSFMRIAVLLDQGIDGRGQLVGLHVGAFLWEITMPQRLKSSFICREICFSSSFGLCLVPWRSYTAFVVTFACA